MKHISEYKGIVRVIDAIRSNTNIAYGGKTTLDEYLSTLTWVTDNTRFSDEDFRILDTWCLSLSQDSIDLVAFSYYVPETEYLAKPGLLNIFEAIFAGEFDKDFNVIYWERPKYIED